MDNVGISVKRLAPTWERPRLATAMGGTLRHWLSLVLKILATGHQDIPDGSRWLVVEVLLTFDGKLG